MHGDGMPQHRAAVVRVVCGELVVAVEPARPGEAKPDPATWDVVAWGTFTGESRLRRILGRGRTKVNSLHHQAVGELGERLAVTGRARDGIVESIEATDNRFVIGVQWHAECLVARADQAALFRAFVQAAERFERVSDRLARAAQCLPAASVRRPSASARGPRLRGRRPRSALAPPSPRC